MEDSIIYELFNARCDDFESGIMKKEKDCNKNLEEITNTFDEILKILPKDIHEIVSQKFELVYRNILKDTTYWCEKYYRFGIKDGIKLKQELKTNIRERREREEHFILDYDADFNDFMENYKINILYKNKEYDNARKGISRILEDYPRVRDFYEDNKLSDFNKDELNAILELIRLDDIQSIIEVRGAFHLGMIQNEIV